MLRVSYWDIRAGCAWQKSNLSRACEFQMFRMFLNIATHLSGDYRRLVFILGYAPPLFIADLPAQQFADLRFGQIVPIFRFAVKRPIILHQTMPPVLREKASLLVVQILANS
jgi:hypothetical protein